MCTKDKLPTLKFCDFNTCQIRKKQTSSSFRSQLTGCDAKSTKKAPPRTVSSAMHFLFLFCSGFVEPDDEVNRRFLFALGLKQCVTKWWYYKAPFPVVHGQFEVLHKKQFNLKCNTSEKRRKKVLLFGAARNVFSVMLSAGP